MAFEGLLHGMSGLVAHWHMNEPSGTTVADDEGGHDGTITGADFTRGEPRVKCGLSLGLNPGALVTDTTRVEVPHAAALNVQDFTVCAWFNPEATFAVDGILSKTVAGDGSRGYSLGKTSFGHGYVSRGDAGLFEDLAYTGQVLTGGQDWFLAGGASSSLLKLWLQGAPVASEAAAQSTNTSNTDPLYLGYDVSAHPTFGYFSGRLDDVCLFNRLLDDAEVLALWNASCAGQRSRAQWIG